MAEQKQSILFLRSFSEHLMISDASQAGLDLTGSFTIEAWVKPLTQVPPGQEYVIVSKWSSSVSDKSYIFLYYHDGQKPTLRLATSATSTSDDVGGGVAYTLPTTVWSHVAVVFTVTTGTAEFFVNARSIGSVGGFGRSVNNGAGQFQIGTRQGLSSVAFDGYIDEVRVWNRARTAQEILASYSAVTIGAQSGLVGAWHFTCGYTDDSGFGNALTPINFPAFSQDSPFGCGQPCVACEP